MGNSKKSFAVLGLGSFGTSLAISLEEQGIEVLAVDEDREIVNKIAPHVTCALQLDVTDEGALKNLSIEKMDGAIISIGENLEASVMATILVKEMGVPIIYAKAENDLQKTILMKVGADKVMFPEKEMGNRLAIMIAGNYRDYVKLSDSIGMVNIDIKETWIDKSLLELNFRNCYHVNVIGVRREGEVVFLHPKDKLRADDQLLVVGELNHLKALH